jgi:Dolichyl-phosphate-mannose-protein mannosyltransferase
MPFRAGYGLAVELPDTPGLRRHQTIQPQLVFQLLLGVFVLLTLALSALAPAWEANDEPDHFRNVQTLVSGHWYRMEPGAGYSAHQAPLYYLGLAALQKVAGIAPFTPVLEDHPKRPERGRFLHNDAESQRRVVLLRLPSIMLGVLTIWLTRRVARRAGLTEWGAVLAAAIVATLPRFVFLSAVMNNDNLVITLGAWATLLAVGLVRDDQISTKRFLGFGVVLGLMLEAKLSAVPIVLALAIGVVIARYAQQRRTNPNASKASSATSITNASNTLNATNSTGTAKSKKISTRSVANRSEFTRALLSVSAGTLLLAAPILVANQLRYGDVLASKASVDYFRVLLPPLVAVPHTWEWFGVAVSSGFATSFWYVSGWNQFRWKAETYVPLWCLAAIGLLGCLVKRGTRKTTTTATSLKSPPNTSSKRTETEQGIPRGVVGLLAGIAIASVSVVWLLATQTLQWQARTSYPGLAAFATLIGIGYRRLRIPTLLQFLLPALTLVGTLYAIHSDVINRYFT